MTDDTRLDARVRGALAELPMPDDNATREALNAVLARSSRPRREPRAWIVPGLVAAAVLALAVLVGSLVDRPSTTEPTPPPPPTDSIVGDWQRQATGADSAGWNGRWRMALSADGVLTLTGPATATSAGDGASFTATDGQFRTDVFVNSACPEQAAGVYEWRTGGSTLTLTLVEDPCAARIDVFAGTWRRVP